MARKNYFSTSKNIIQTHEEDDTARARATTARLLIDVVRSRTFSKAKELTPKAKWLRDSRIPSLREKIITIWNHDALTAQKQGKLMLFRTTLNFCHRSFGGNVRTAARCATAAAARCCCRGWHRLQLRRKNNRSDSGSIKKSMHAEWLPGNSTGHLRNSGSHNRRRRRVRGWWLRFCWTGDAIG